MRRSIVVTFLMSFGVLSAAAYAYDNEGVDARKVVEPEVYAELEASADRRAYVIVILEQVATAGIAQQQRREVVKRVQDGVLSKLTPDEFSIVHKYQNFAALTGRANARGLTKLAATPEVRRVGLDALGHGHLDDSIPFINADGVHSLGYTGDGITVAVLDTGIDSDHPDLSDNVAPGWYHFLDQGATQGPGAEDDHGHGTNVSGIITSGGAVAPLGVAPDAEILAIKVLDASNSGWVSDWAAGVDYVVTNKGGYHNLCVINMSLGTDTLYSDCPCDNADVWTQLAQISLDAAKDAGIVIFASSGNNGSCTQMSSPACLSAATAVAAVYDQVLGREPDSGTYWDAFGGGWPSCFDSTTAGDKIACFSNRSGCNALAGPGRLITAPGMGGGTSTFTGTSQAAPHCAGVAVLMCEKAESLGMELTPDQIVQIMKCSGVPTVDQCGTHPNPIRVDAAASIASIAEENHNPLLYNGTVVPPSGTVATTFEYLVSYSDPDCDPPYWVVVVIDGTEYSMSLKSGRPANGTYHYMTSLPIGTYHNFWFHARDIRNGVDSTRLYYGPDVGDGTGDDLVFYNEPGKWNDDDPADGDHIPEAGEDVLVQVCLKNMSSKTLTGVVATLTCSLGNVNITDDTVSYGTIESAEKLWPGDEFDMFLDFASTTEVEFTLHVSYMKESVEYQQDIPFSMTFYEQGYQQPIFNVCNVVVDDSQWGDNDGIPESGEEVEFDLYLENIGNADATDVEAKFSNLSVGSSTDEERWYGYPDLSAGGSCEKQLFSDYNFNNVPRSATGWLHADVTVKCAGNPDQVIAYEPLFEIIPTSWLCVSPDEWDFGVSSTSVDVTKNVTVENCGTASLTVNGISTSDPDTTWTGDPLPWIISAGASKTVQVQIETSGLQGQISREVVIQPDPDAHISNDRIVITGLVSDLPAAYEVPGATSPYKPDVGGTVIAWRDYRNSNEDIYAYDSATGAEFPVCTDPAWQSSPKVSGNLIAWEDRRNWDGQGEVNNDIYAYDMSDQNELTISTDAFHETLVGVDGNIVAFTRVFHIWTEPSHYGPDPTNLYFYNIDTGETVAVTTYSYNGHNPMGTVTFDNDFGGGILTWKECELVWNGSRWIIADSVLQKLQVGVDPSPIEIFSGSVGEGPSANDGKVAWASAETTYPYDRHIWVWEGGSAWQVPPTPEPDVDYASGNLAVGDDIVVYDKEGSQLFYWDLVSNSEGIATNMTGSDQCRMDQHCLVWVSNNKVWYAFLKEADLAVAPPDIEFSDTQPYEGDIIDVNLTVHNLNPWATTEDVAVRLYDSYPNDPNTQLGSDEVISGGITGQASAVVTFNDIPVGTEGSHNIYACIDVSGDNPGNNKAYKTLIVGDTDTQGPTISNVVAQEYNGDGDGCIGEDEQVLISWQATDTSGINSSWCTIDANDYPASGTYYVVVGPYPAGDYDFTVSATDGDVSPETSEYSSNFVVGSIADLNCDGKANCEDLQILCDQWLGTPGTPSADIYPAPPDGDGIVDFHDFAVFAEHCAEHCIAGSG